MGRVCPVCGGTAWDSFLESGNGRVLTGDQRIEAGHLSKMICTGCGVVANAHALTGDELRVLYGEAYQLNTYGREEHLFFTAQGPVPRSQVIFEWLVRFLPERAKTVLEIGCGEGNVLARFAALERLERVSGFEGSRKAAELARSKGLDVQNELILSTGQSIPRSDFVFCYSVLEHVEDIDLFISSLVRACAPDGRIVFGLPVQDERGYDLFFAEHVWHFTTGHVKQLLERRGLRVVNLEADHPVNRGAGVFVCTIANAGEPSEDPAPPIRWRELQIANRDYWTGLFEKANDLLEDIGDRLAVYGSGEVLSLFLCHTNLGGKDIVACIDENLDKAGTRKHGIPIHGPRHLASLPIDAVLLTVNPRYNEQVRAKLAPLKLRVLSFFD